MARAPAAPSRCPALQHPVHPMLVHFPIGLIAVALYVINLWIRAPALGESEINSSPSRSSARTASVRCRKVALRDLMSTARGITPVLMFELEGSRTVQPKSICERSR